MFSVSQAAILLGVHPATIRRWDRHRTIRCSRTPGGHRRITAEQNQRIVDGKKRRYKRKNRGVVTYVKQEVSMRNFS